MKYTKKSVNETTVSYAVDLDASDLAAVRPLTLAKLSQNLKIPGFRAGKIPPTVAERHLDPMTVTNQIVEDAINAYVIDIIQKDDDVQPLDRPKVDVGEFTPSEKLSFTASVEVLPKVQLGDYKKLKVTRDKTSVSAAEVTEVIDRMRQGYATKEEVTRVAKNDDEVWIDFAGTDESGAPVDGTTGTDYPLRIGSGTFIPGFEEGLLGHKTGDVFDLPLSFPDDYHHDPLKGKKVTFKTTVKKVNAVTLPKVDDEFAAKVGPFTSVDQMKSDIKSELLAQKDRAADDNVKDQLVEQLVKASTVPAPESLVHEQMHAIERDAIANLSYRGQTPEDYVASKGYKDREEWVHTEFREAAERRVQVGLALAEVSKAEAIDVTQAELEERLERYKQESPKVSAQFDTPESRRDVANRVMTEKTVDRLLELNVPKISAKK